MNRQQTEDQPYNDEIKGGLYFDDFEEFKNKSSDNSLLYYSFQQSNNFVLYLPSTEINIICQIIDQRGSITNIQKSLNISKKQVTFNNLNIDQLTFLQKISWIFEILIIQNDKQNCTQLKDEIYNYIQQQVTSDVQSEKLLAYQTINLYKKVSIKQANSNSTRRLLEQKYQNQCYNNETSLFIITNQEVTQKNSINISSLTESSQKVQSQIVDLIQLRINLENQNSQSNLIVDSQLVMMIKTVTQILIGSVHLIDEQYLIISQNETSPQYYEEVMKISETLIQLIENITIQISDNLQVNGQVLSFYGAILSLQLQKITKSVYNAQFQIQYDYLDNLIAFIQKSQLKVSFNYYNLSQSYRTMLQIYLNRSDFENDQNYFVKSFLTNYLYTGSQINQLQLQYILQN
ncbi:unnamed protein product (macronuclear) [Paramecium tetraurelia]|uniref:Uncharacterized protein n=1 Tax=Paramecium tetraurelia TaxID=5888 RepID=A0CUU3_PARTE|nr:uncharacterized protein GSPATT00039014001 [Paramecium tetraurelia]CAK74560.1 unnamed protein product [Paramecium tetraurelia]|eukprot:XP_001441957.1 hypothetical protein (macronuclear) [Paramecium tetraurelia strain d4-2]